MLKWRFRNNFQEISLVGFDDIPEAGFFRPPFVDNQTGFCRPWPAKYPMLDGTGRSELGNPIDSYNPTVSYQARKHRSVAGGILTSPQERRTRLDASGLISDFSLWAAWMPISVKA